MIKRILTLALLGEIVVAPGFAGDKKFAFGLKGGFYSPSSSTFNQGSVSPTNLTLEYFGSILRAAGVSPAINKLDKMGWAMTLGGEIEVYLWPRISVALAAECWRSTRQASVEAPGGGGAGNGFSGFNYQFEVTASLIPIFTTVRYHFGLPLKGLAFHVGGGAGYCLGRIGMNWNSPYVGSDILESKGSAFVFHLSGGCELRIFEFLSAALDIRYPLGKIKEFMIVESSRSTEKKLTFADENGELKAFQWELDGPNIGLYLKVRF
jgi:hypothetical protein